MPKGSNTISRREAVKLAGAAGATSLLAGCGQGNTDGNGNGSNNGSDSDDLGERVPSQPLTYFTGHAGTPFHERVVPLLIDYWGQLGLDMSAKPTEIGEAIMEPWDDQRVSPLPIWNHSPTLPRLDPETMLRRFRADFAGPGGDPNTPNYVNCEASADIDRVMAAPSPEIKEEATYDALEKISEDLAIITLGPEIVQGAYNSDRVSVDPGPAGISGSNAHMYATLETSHSDTIVASASTFVAERINMLTIGDGRANAVWSGLFHSPLFLWDNEFNLINVLAEDYEVSDGGTTFTVTLIDGATFHNGDDLTADDVVWTFETLLTNAGDYPYFPEHEGEFEAIDDRTVRVTFPDPAPSTPTLLLARWGIMHPDTWDPGLLDDPSGFQPTPDEFVGSGPYEIADFTSGQFLSLEPFDDHQVYSPENPLFFQAFEDRSTAVESFIAGEVDILADLGGGNMDRLRDAAPEDTTEFHEVPTFVPSPVYPQMQYPPTQFREFRLAAGTALNLEEINEIARFGASEPEPYSTIFMKAHPFRPPEDRLTRYTEDISGDIERAQEILAEAGWGWDDDGRLHYPPDADLTPVWPEGESPQPEDFECIGEGGDYQSLYDEEEED